MHLQQQKQILKLYNRYTITELIQPISDLKIPQLKSRKWSITAKKNFITDYKNLPITELCQKHSITPRTAQEYNRIFLVDLENI